MCSGEQALIATNHAEWPLKAIGEVCQIVSRGTAPSYVSVSEVFAIGQRCVTNSGFEAKAARPHNARSMHRVLRPISGDVLLNSTGTGTIGRTCVFDEVGQFIVDGHVTLLRPGCDLDGRWLNTLFTHPNGQNRLETRCYSGSTNQVELSRTALILTLLPLPPLPEQRRIAEILDTLDAAIRQTEAVIAKLSQVKQGLLHDLLTRGIDGNGELRRPVEEARELYRETELGWVPRGWGVSVVGAECQIHNNLRKPIASDIRERMQGEYPYYGPTGVLDHINEYRVDGKFVLIGEDGDHFLKFSTWAMTQLVSGRFNVSNHAHILSGIGNLSTEWVHYYFRHRDVTLFTTRQGAGRFKLNQASLRKLPLPIPPPAEQEGIIARMVALEGREEGERHQRAKLRTLKQGLMDDLLTGRVRVK